MRIALSKLICILLLSTKVCAQHNKTWIVVGGDKPPAVVDDTRVIRFFDNMNLDIMISDSLHHTVLVTGDHKFFENQQVHRQVVCHYNTGKIDTNMIRTDEQMQVYYFNHYIHKRLEVSKYILEE
tara:strand:- start:3791 stop:4165 length:375 start_codon:yes stop_codon:yes gene_type:complete